MKITKRQLRRIIKEEKAKLLRESVSDMIHFEEAADQSASRMANLFYDDMMKLYDEEPDAFAHPDSDGSGMTQTPKDVWEQQVVYATQELETAISFAIAETIERIEMQLHDGQYHDGR